MRRVVVLAITGTALLVLCGVVVFRAHRPHARSFGRSSPTGRESPTQAPVRVPQPMTSTRLIDRAATAEAKMRSAFTTPISFYGRVVDQNGDAVPDASVTLDANDKPGGTPTHYNRTTDANGWFSIEGIRGISLAVEVSRSGYRSIPPQRNAVASSGLFEYAVPTIQGPRPPDKQHPAVFTLYKLGPPQDIAAIPKKDVRIDRNGTPATISLDSTTGHTVIIRCWSADLGRPAEQRQYDWKVEISIPDGGLQPRQDDIEFAAQPEALFFGRVISTDQRAIAISNRIDVTTGGRLSRRDLWSHWLPLHRTIPQSVRLEQTWNLIVTAREDA